MDKAAIRLRMSYPATRFTAAQRLELMAEFAAIANIPINFFKLHPVGQKVWEDVEAGLVS